MHIGASELCQVVGLFGFKPLSVMIFCLLVIEEETSVKYQNASLLMSKQSLECYWESCAVSTMLHTLMMTSLRGGAFRIAGLLWGETTIRLWIHLTKGHECGFLMLLWRKPEQTFEQTVEWFETPGRSYNVITMCYWSANGYTPANSISR